MVWASVFIVLLVGCVFFYNQLAKLDALADEAWKEALNRFERRYGLLASLADTAAGKTQRTEELCSRARRCAEIDTDIKQRQNAENELGNAVRLFFAETENEENASEDPQFLLLKQKFAEAEEELQNARRRYNAAVRDYNVALHTVPTCSKPAAEKRRLQTADRLNNRRTKGESNEPAKQQTELMGTKPADCPGTKTADFGL